MIRAAQRTLPKTIRENRNDTEPVRFGFLQELAELLKQMALNAPPAGERFLAKKRLEDACAKCEAISKELAKADREQVPLREHHIGVAPPFSARRSALPCSACSVRAALLCQLSIATDQQCGTHRTAPNCTAPLPYLGQARTLLKKWDVEEVVVKEVLSRAQRLSVVLSPWCMVHVAYSCARVARVFLTARVCVVR
jgi:hypothetical protein